MGMRVVIDGCCLGRKKTGNETYLRGLLSGLQEVSVAGCDLSVITTTAHRGERPETFEWIDIPQGNFLSRNFLTIPSELTRFKGKTSIYHATYWTRFWSEVVPSVVMIHDISFVSFPQGFKKHEQWIYAGLIEQVAKRSRHIVTVSEFSKRDMIERWKIPGEKITVTYDGLDDCYRPASGKNQEMKGEETPYILYVGNLHPRKNLVRLLKAFVLLKEETKLRHRLKIVGQAAWMFEDIFEAVRRHRLEEAVDFTGYVSQEELIRLYQQATVTVYPSLFEGFGLPVLEAMGCGSPVVTSKTTSIPEVAGEACVLVNPESVEDIAGAMEKVLVSEKLQAELREKGLRQSEKFTWKQMADKTLEVWRSVDNEKAGSRSQDTRS